MAVKEEIRKFRKALGLVFDDNLETGQWYNIVDWVIVGMILLSSVEIFLATFPWPPRMEHVLNVINTVTLWFFVVEVTLRIWAAPERSPEYRGFKGRVRYCLTFYGLIDFISTYPFLIQFFVPLPLSALRILRTARIIRIFRITRYAKSFAMLSNAVREKRSELIVSMQFLLIVTFILGLCLFFYEHEAQPDVYDNGFVSMIWAFAQYIGEAGQFADTPPVSVAGKFIAFFIGLLGIAIVAVPAGILGAGFTETIERDSRRRDIEENTKKLYEAFQRKYDGHTGFQVKPTFLSVATLQARLSVTEEDIVNAVNSNIEVGGWQGSTDCQSETDSGDRQRKSGKERFRSKFRLVNTASTIPMGVYGHPGLAVEHFIVNRKYGLFIDRGSKITIISPSSYIDAGTGNWAFYLALVGGFNYISREIGNKADTRSFFNHPDPAGQTVEGLPEYLDDLHTLLDRPDAWSVTVRAASGETEPTFPTHIHFDIGGQKGDTRMGGDPDMFVSDTNRYGKFLDDMIEALEDKFGIGVDHHKYYSASGPMCIFRQNRFANGNNIVMRVEWEKMVWNPCRIAIAVSIAEIIAHDLADASIAPDPALTVKSIAYDGYALV